jgi:hypothetical protein
MTYSVMVVLLYSCIYVFSYSNGDVLGNLLRSLADGVLTSLVACAAVGQGGGNIECETHGNEGAETHGTVVLYKVASTLAWGWTWE